MPSDVNDRDANGEEDYDDEAEEKEQEDEQEEEQEARKLVPNAGNSTGGLDTVVQTSATIAGISVAITGALKLLSAHEASELFASSGPVVIGLFNVVSFCSIAATEWALLGLYRGRKGDSPPFRWSLALLMIATAGLGVALVVFSNNPTIRQLVGLLVGGR